MSVFSREEARIGKSLRKRIESWKTRVPSTQFQQYGPLDRFFNRFLGDDDFMVKPQALFRPEFEDVEASRLVKRYGIEDAGPDSRPVDPMEAQILQDTREDIEAGNLSIDSMNVLVSKTLAARKYPDFALCTFGENPRVDGGGQDQVLAIVEIASCANKARLDDVKLELMDQLMEYMETLGEGGRWKDWACGIAIIGTEVAFLLPRKPGSKSSTEMWVRHGIHSKRQWFSLYGEDFIRIMERIRRRGAEA